MKRTYISLIAAGVFAIAATPAVAQLKVTGTASATGIATDVNSRNRWRFEEYRDMDSGVIGNADIRGETDTHYLRFFGDNLGREDYLIDFSGGKYGDYKYSIYNNKILHNLTFGAISPFTGVGTNTLTFPGALGATPSTDVSTWTRFDYKVEHENTGGVFEISKNSPFYFRTTANYKETKGIKPLGAAGTSPGGPSYELQLPVDFRTTDVGAEAGYASRTQQYSISVSHSKFEDHNDFLNWRNPSITAGASTTTMERNTIAADNHQWKVALNALWKQLPYTSTFALRGTYSQTANSLPVATTYTNVTGTTGAIRLSNPNTTIFDGDVVHTTLSASLTSQPMKALDTRVYYNYTEKDNRSTQIVFTPGPAGTAGVCDINPATGTTTGSTTCSNELFHLKKHNVGVDAQYRVNPSNRIGAGLDFTDVKRERIDFDENQDWKTTLEWKNNSLETLTTRLKYQHLNRTARFLEGGNPEFFSRTLYRFDVAPLSQDLAKVVFEYNPLPLIDLGAELIYKRNNYKSTVLGRTRDNREELYLSAAFGEPKAFRVTAFLDVEFTQNDSTHVQGAATAFPPPGTSTVFSWEGKVKEKNYIVGLAADWQFREWLKFAGSVIWQQADGTVDFATQNNVVTPQNIGAYDSFRKIGLNLKATAPLQKNAEITVGAAYEHFKYSDASFDNYRYTPVTGTNQNFLSGAYAFPAYNARIAYVSLRYFFR